MEVLDSTPPTRTWRAVPGSPPSIETPTSGGAATWAYLVARNGVAVILTAISFDRKVRIEICKTVGAIVESYARGSLDELIRQAPNDLYEKAPRGEMEDFTEVSDPYEPSLCPGVTCDTDEETVAELRSLGYVTAQ